MAASGAKVLMLRAVEIARGHGVRIHARSTSRTSPGTWCRRPTRAPRPSSARSRTRSTTCFTLRGLEGEPAAAILRALADEQVNVDTIGWTAGGAGRARVLGHGRRRPSARAALARGSRIGGIEAEEMADLGKVSIVGAGMRSHPGVAARMFRALDDEGIEPRTISTSPVKMTCLVDRDSVERGVRALHRAFELGASPATSPDGATAHRERSARDRGPAGGETSRALVGGLGRPRPRRPPSPPLRVRGLDRPRRAQYGRLRRHEQRAHRGRRDPQRRRDAGGGRALRLGGRRGRCSRSACPGLPVALRPRGGGRAAGLVPDRRPRPRSGRRCSACGRSRSRSRTRRSSRCSRAGATACRPRSGVVDLDLRPIVLDTADRIGLRDEVEDRLPADAGTIEVLRSDELDTAQDAFQLLKTLAWLLPVLTLGAFALVVWLAGDRRRACGRIGSRARRRDPRHRRRAAHAGTTSSTRSSRTGTRDAAGNAWDILTELLRGSFRWLVAIGVLFLVAAWLAGPAPGTRRAAARAGRPRAGVGLRGARGRRPDPPADRPGERLRPLPGGARVRRAGRRLDRGDEEQTLREFPEAAMPELFSDAARASRAGGGRSGAGRLGGSHRHRVTPSSGDVTSRLAGGARGPPRARRAHGRGVRLGQGRRARGRLSEPGRLAASRPNSHGWTSRATRSRPSSSVSSGSASSPCSASSCGGRTGGTSGGCPSATRRSPPGGGRRSRSCSGW